MTIASENAALTRLATYEWQIDGACLRMKGVMNIPAAKQLASDLGDEAREALGYQEIGGRISLRRSRAEPIFRMEGLTLQVKENGRQL